MQCLCSVVSSGTWLQATAEVCTSSACVSAGGTQAKFPSCPADVLLFWSSVQRSWRVSSAAREKQPATEEVEPWGNLSFQSSLCRSNAPTARKCPRRYPRAKAKSNLPSDQKLNHKIKSFSKVPTKEESILGCENQQLLLPPTEVVQEGKLQMRLWFKSHGFSEAVTFCWTLTFWYFRTDMYGGFSSQTQCFQECCPWLCP